MSDVPPLPLAPGLTVPEEQPGAVARRLAFAFQSVFGQPDHRSADQKRVMDHLRMMCNRDGSCFKPDATGAFDPLRAAHIDGAQTQFLIIKRQLAKARRDAEEQKKPKPKSKR